MTRWLAAVLLLLPFVAAAEERAALVVSGGVVAVRLPDAVLRHAAVRRQLESGLTTTFLLVANRAGERAGAARLEIRYDLWDEIYHVRRVETGRAIDAKRIVATELDAWFRTPVRLFVTADRRIVAEVELRVLPFSGAEEKAARQWLSRSSAAGGQQSATLIDVLIGTTLTARPVVSFRWPLEAGR